MHHVGIASPVAVLLAAACSGSGSAETRYGDVELELRSSDAEPDTTFVGTDRIVATLSYGACLEEFYREHDDLSFAGPDGAEVVEAWRDRLCDDDTLAKPIACDVAAIVQVLDAGPPRMIVTYALRSGSTGGALALGPLPEGPSAGCRGAAVPEVHVGADALRGLDADGTEIWTGGSSQGTDAVVDQDAPVVIYAGRLVPP